MPVYLINSYDITDVETFQLYPPKVLPLLNKYGAKILASDPKGTPLEGKPKTMNVVIEFPSEESVWNCYNDPDYAELKKVRWDTTANCTMVIVKPYTY